MSEYLKTQENEVFEIPLDEPWEVACCDCGLVHTMTLVIEDGKLYASGVRNNRSTAQLRRHRTYPLLTRKS